MEQAPHQRVPIMVHFGEGARPPLDGVTRRFGPERVDVALPAGDWVPPRGTPVRFSARLAGQTVDGRGRVAGCSAGPGLPGERVLDLEVTSLSPEAEVIMRSVGFRQRLEGWIESHPAEDGAWPEALRRPQGAPMTRPTDDADRPPRVVPPRPADPPAAMPSPSPPDTTADGGTGRPRRPRTRPRARRHHWDLDSRFRPGG